MSLVSSFDISTYCGAFQANRTVRDRIVARIQTGLHSRNISVTDLVSVRQAYWARVRPDIRPDMERSADMLAGSAFHDAFNWKVSSEEWIEQTVYYQDVVGRIDIFQKKPLELKTSKTPVEPHELKTLRPGYLEQLGLYCAMVGQTDGYILIYNRGQGRVLIGASVHFLDIGDILKELLCRRDLLRQALENRNPALLPPCPWKGKGCLYEDICDCEPQNALFPIADLAEVQADQALEEEFAERFKEAPSPERGGTRINDLVFPRKTFFKSAKKEEHGELSDDLAALDGQAFMQNLKYRGLGVSGELTSKPVEFGDVTGRVEFHEGRTLWFTRSGVRKPIERYRLPAVLAHALLRLGFNAVLANRGRSRLVVYYPNVNDDNSRIMVYDFTWTDLRPIRDEMVRRTGALKSARSSMNHAALPMCPSWMCQRCEFSQACVGS